jgi:hypothetical protein
MSNPDVLLQTGSGSVDWAGGTAPAGGEHSGVCTLVMQDGNTFRVACSKAEAEYRLASLPIQPFPQWIGFDIPNSGVGTVIDGSNVRTVV